MQYGSKRLDINQKGGCNMAESGKRIDVKGRCNIVTNGPILMCRGGAI